ncbi:MAG TPA: tetratricopeptide repeat protein [Blastocatellia bacterium]|nr:tetratricopeptide repeat protein [Blastocatellia bacterium]
MRTPERTRHVFVLIALFMLVIPALVAVVGASPRANQASKQKNRPPKKAPAPVETADPATTPREALDRARSATTQDERIKLLEKFLVSYRSSELEPEARQQLMREYSLKGEQALREANPQQAAQAFKSVFRNAPFIITDKIFSQYIFPLPIAMNAFGYRAESVDLMRTFESRFQDQPNRLVEIGFFYVQIEAPFEAVRLLERAVQLAPNDHRAHNSLGTAYLISLRLDDAATEFQKALELDARDEYANLNLGHLARASGEYERAVGFYRKQLTLKSDDAEAHGGLGIALLASGRDEEAAPEIKRAMELAPGDYRFMTQLAVFYTTRKKPALARPLIEKAIRVERRYAWAFIAKAEVDLLENKYGDALSTMLAAQSQASFATLTFELAKSLMTVDGYDQATEVMNRSFKINEDGEFETLLGGAIKARSPRLDLLLERERQAALFLSDHPTTSLQYRLAEALVKIDYYSKTAVAARKPAPAKTAATRGKAGRSKAAARETAADDDESQALSRPRRVSGGPLASAELSAGSDAGLPGVPELMRAITSFTTLDDGRQVFRMVWAARKLTGSGIALDAAVQLSQRAIAMADAATEPAGSMRDAPLLEREGRRLVFLGRAFDALGWAQFKKGDTRGAVANLLKSVETYPPSLEKKAAIWHLAVAMEETGDERRALDLYIASYDAEMPTSSVRRAQIESLYRKLNGSLAGLEDKLKQQ